MDITKYLDHIKASYANWHGELTEVRQQMIVDFNENLTFEVGKKYIKVTTGKAGSGRSVHSFIVNVENDKQFKYGDILKPAGWNAPARNFPRGNILEDNFGNTTWTGPH